MANRLATGISQATAGGGSGDFPPAARAHLQRVAGCTRDGGVPQGGVRARAGETARAVATRSREAARTEARSADGLRGN